MQNDRIILLAGERTGGNWVSEVCCKYFNYTCVKEPSNPKNRKNINLKNLSMEINEKDMREIYSDFFNREKPFNLSKFIWKNSIDRSNGIFLKITPFLPQNINLLTPYNKEGIFIFLLRDFFSRLFSKKAFVNDLKDKEIWAKQASNENEIDFLKIHMTRYCKEIRTFLDSILPPNIFYYEYLYKYPDIEYRRLFTILGCSTNIEIDKETLKTPSVSAKESSLIRNNKDQITGWRDQITPEVREIANKIIKEYGLDHLYNEEGMPNEKLG